MRWRGDEVVETKKKVDCNNWRQERGYLPSEQRRWGALWNCRVLGILILVNSLT